MKNTRILAARNFPQPKRKYGWRPDKHDHRDLIYSASAPAAHLPESVDLRPLMPAVYDQGDLGSCTANAIAGVLEYREIRQRRHSVEPPSRLFIYFNERRMEGTIDQDAGAMIRDGIKSLGIFGYAPEAIWPYDVARFKTRPSQIVYDEAKKGILHSYARVPQSELGLMTCLAEGNPVVFGFTVFPSFESSAVMRSGIYDGPKAKEFAQGGHAVCLVGYQKINGRLYFIMRNSWGDDVGQAGYFMMAANFLINADYCNDFWCVRFKD